MQDLICKPLGPEHNRAAFLCEESSLTEYIKTKARKERDEGFCAVFVASFSDDDKNIVGYYTVSNFSVELSHISTDISKKFPRYPQVPVTMIGRLARHIDHRKKGIGDYLLIDALKRAFDASQNIGSVAVVVDPINEIAADLYKKFGFIHINNDNQRLYMPMGTIEKLGL